MIAVAHVFVHAVFHALDALALALVPMASISERRLYRLLDAIVCKSMMAKKLVDRHLRNYARRRSPLDLDVFYVGLGYTILNLVEHYIGSDAIIASIQGYFAQDKFAWFTGLPLLLTPILIAFLEMVIDPVCSVVFEAEGEEGDLMQRPPRRAAAELLSLPVALWSLLQGLLVLAFLAAIYLLAAGRGMPVDESRVLVFVSLVMANMALVVVNRSFGFAFGSRHTGSTWALGIVYAAAGAILTVAILWPPARELFHFGAFHGHDLAIAIGGCFLLIVVLEAVKRLLRSRLVA